MDWNQIYSYQTAEPHIGLWVSITPIIWAAASLCIYAAVKNIRESLSPNRWIFSAIGLITFMSCLTYYAERQSYNDLVLLVQSEPIRTIEGVIKSEKTMVVRQHGEKISIGATNIFRPSRTSAFTGCLKYIPYQVQNSHIRMSYIVLKGKGPKIDWQSEESKRFDIYCILSLEQKSVAYKT